MINVSKRIEGIVSLIEYDTLVDIGSDHGFIPIYAVYSDKAKFAVASDLNEAPLKSSENNILKYGMSENIKTILSDGLKNIEEDYETLTICGMGGLLVIDILKYDEDKTKKFSQLILQPQKDYAEVRKTVYELGFYIKNETYLIDNIYSNKDDKFYIIFNCLKQELNDKIKYPTEKEFLCGINVSIDSIDVYRKYIDNALIKAKIAYKSLNNAKTDTKEKENYYKNFIKYLEEVNDEITKNM